MYQNKLFGVKHMKIFVSWSGTLSKKIAELIKKWLPCFIQAAEIFFSPEDIEKGENWDSKISKELSECKYGIICLTAENVTAPWINFEAGAIAKTLDSRVATLMININPSEIKGPLSRYQATKLEKDDFFQLVENINKQCDTPVNSEVLRNTFSGLWDSMLKEMNDVVSKTKATTPTKKKDAISSEAVEEILQLLRKQSSLLSSPNQLLPVDYFEYLNDTVFRTSTNGHHVETIEEITQFCMWLISRAEMDDEKKQMLQELQFDDLVSIINRHVSPKTNRQLFMQARELRIRYSKLFESDAE